MPTTSPGLPTFSWPSALNPSPISGHAIRSTVILIPAVPGLNTEVEVRNVSLGISFKTRPTKESATPRLGSQAKPRERAGPLPHRLPHKMEGRGLHPSSAPSHNAGRDYINAPGGIANKSDGSGNHLPGATFHGPVSFGKSAPAGSRSFVAHSLLRSPPQGPRRRRGYHALFGKSRFALPFVRLPSHTSIISGLFCE